MRLQNENKMFAKQQICMQNTTELYMQNKTKICTKKTKTNKNEKQNNLYMPSKVGVYL